MGDGQCHSAFYNTTQRHLGWTLSAITAHQLPGDVAQWEQQQRNARVVMPAPAA